MSERWEGKLEKQGEYRWVIPTSYMKGMRVPGLIYASERFLEHIRLDKTPQQVANVACLPGIVKWSLAMPDIHWGYGLPIGGVAATRLEDGIISPGGVGSDINCGVRLVRTNLEVKEIKDKLPSIIDALYQNIPCGVGSEGRIRLSAREEEAVMRQGARWAVEANFGWEEDLVFTEEQGELEGAEPAQVSQRARERGTRQVGTLGAGNHFLELQKVEEIFEPESAQKMGLEKGQLTIMIHSGSRGFGFQICEDYVKKMLKAQPKYNISLPDKQLACAPFNSPEGRAYWGAMACAANYAWANRQCLMHWTRETIARVLKSTPKALGMSLVYDVAHNIGKLEEHEVEGKKEKLCVHRKGATRAFPPHHPAVPEKYKEIGQPVIIPGDMGSSSYVLCGTARAMKETFGSTCHGAGRVMSRSKAIRSVNSEQLLKELTQKGIYIRARGRKTLAEECPQAYKDIDEVVEIVHNAGLSKKVAKFKPLGVIKG